MSLLLFFERAGNRQGVVPEISHDVEVIGLVYLPIELDELDILAHVRGRRRGKWAKDVILGRLALRRGRRAGSGECPGGGDDGGQANPLMPGVNWLVVTVSARTLPEAVVVHVEEQLGSSMGAAEAAAPLILVLGRSS